MCFYIFDEHVMVLVALASREMGFDHSGSVFSWDGSGQKWLFRAFQGCVFGRNATIVNFMKIIFDPAKDAGNREKHGLSLEDAAHLDWENALMWNDTRHDYGEPRQVALALLAQRVHVVVFVERQEGRRIISLRKANVKEVMHYVNTLAVQD